MNIQVIIPAAGSGVRLNAGRPKALVEVAGVPLLVRTLRRFALPGRIQAGPVIILVPAEEEDLFHAVLREYPVPVPFRLVHGGDTRQASVANGIAAAPPSVEIVLIHDAARPFVTDEAIALSLEHAVEYGAATVAIPSIDTMLLADESGFLCDTPDRRRMWACQTPQTFRIEVIREAFRRAAADHFTGTDDASLVSRMGLPVKLVMGSPGNIKITTPFDLAVATALVEKGLVPC